MFAHEKELQGVLSEQAEFGVTDVEMLPVSSNATASAQIKLPEGKVEVIVLSNRGFYVGQTYCIAR